MKQISKIILLIQFLIINAAFSQNEIDNSIFSISEPNAFGIRTASIYPELYKNRKGNIKNRKLKKASEPFKNWFLSNDFYNLYNYSSNNNPYNYYYLDSIENSKYKVLEEIYLNDKISDTWIVEGFYGGRVYIEAEPIISKVIYKIEGDYLFLLSYIGEYCSYGEPGFYFDLNNDGKYERSKDVSYYLNYYSYKNKANNVLRIKGNNSNANGIGYFSNGYLHLKVPLNEVKRQGKVHFGFLYGEIKTKKNAIDVEYKYSKYLKLPARTFQSKLNNNNTMWYKENMINFKETYSIKVPNKKRNKGFIDLEPGDYLIDEKIFGSKFIRVYSDGNVAFVNAIYSYALFYHYLNKKDGEELPLALTNKGGAEFVDYFESKTSGRKIELIGYFDKNKLATIVTNGLNDITFHFNGSIYKLYKVKDKLGCVYGNCIDTFSVYKYHNGDTYQGSFKDGEKDGKGIYTRGIDRIFYKGNWKEGRITKGQFYTTFKLDKSYLKYIPDPYAFFNDVESEN